MKWLIVAGLMVLPLAAVLATHLSAPPQDTGKLPHLITGSQPAPAPVLGVMITTSQRAAAE